MAVVLIGLRFGAHSIVRRRPWTANRAIKYHEKERLASFTWVIVGKERIAYQVHSAYVGNDLKRMKRLPSTYMIYALDLPSRSLGLY